MKNGSNKRYYSATEISRLYGLSRTAVFKKIQSGEIPAEKVGRNYIIDVKNLHIDSNLPKSSRKEINSAVKRAVKEYREVFEKLGKE
ncbi:MAG TPA: helix-turn-helix domain-containing protein [Candidatus Paceibacterota bacterium]|nr:helix-turn-helix domain-containing protein [Candidatus Paceibacterota bacterium]